MEATTPAPVADPNASVAAAGQPPLLEAREVSKYFGAVVAIEGVPDRPGGPGSRAARRQRRRQVDAIRPCPASTCRTRARSRRRRPGRLLLAPRRARCRVATVYQDLAIMPLMSVTRNFFLRPRAPAVAVRLPPAGDRRGDERIGIDIHATRTRPSARCPAAVRQDAGACPRRFYRVLILDEPTRHSASSNRRSCCATSSRPATAASG